MAEIENKHIFIESRNGENEGAKSKKKNGEKMPFLPSKFDNFMGVCGMGMETTKLQSYSQELIYNKRFFASIGGKKYLYSSHNFSVKYSRTGSNEDVTQMKYVQKFNAIFQH